MKVEKFVVNDLCKYYSKNAELLKKKKNTFSHTSVSLL